MAAAKAALASGPESTTAVDPVPLVGLLCTAVAPDPYARRAGCRYRRVASQCDLVPMVRQRLKLPDEVHGAHAAGALPVGDLDEVEADPRFL